MFAVVDLHDNSISLYEEEEAEPVAIIRLNKIIVRQEEEK